MSNFVQDGDASRHFYSGGAWFPDYLLGTVPMNQLTITILGVAFGFTLISAIAAVLAHQSARRGMQVPPDVPLGKVSSWFYRPGDLAGAFIIYLFFAGLFALACMAPPMELEDYTPAAIIVSIMFQLFLAGGVVAMATRNTKFNDWLGWRWEKWPWLFLIGPGAVAFMIAVFYVIQLSGYMEWMESLGVETMQETVTLLQEGKDPVVLILLIITATIIAPICEEVVFRGYLHPILKKFGGVWAAAFLLIPALQHRSRKSRGDAPAVHPRRLPRLDLRIHRFHLGTDRGALLFQCHHGAGTNGRSLFGHSQRHAPLLSMAAMSGLGDLGEDQLIAKLLEKVPVAEGAAGPGDDCAVVEREDGPLQLLKTDAMVEGVHWSKDTEAQRVGWKAVARVISDFAAMGGRPKEFLITLAMPKTTAADWASALYEGMGDCLRKHGGVIVGGETAGSPDNSPIMISVAATGEVERAQLTLRSGAEAGDTLLVTGQLGGSIAGKHLDFSPRIDEAEWLTSQFKPSAMMDLSDGLAKDLPRLAEASACGFQIKGDNIPCSEGCTTEQAIGDGEDYELLFAIGADQVDALLGSWREKFAGLPLTVIGSLCAIEESDQLEGGWDHFGPGT